MSARYFAMSYQAIKIGLFCAVAFLLWRDSPCLALDSQKLLRQFAHTSWSAKDGIPGPVRAIVQTRDGYLWLATETGLSRFDGIRFTSWAPSHGEQWLGLRFCHSAWHLTEVCGLGLGMALSAVCRMTTSQTSFLPRTLRAGKFYPWRKTAMA